MSVILEAVAAGVGALIQWALKQGASEEQILEAFRKEPTVPLAIVSELSKDIQEKLGR